MYFLSTGRDAVDHPQKVQPLLMAMAVVAHADDRAIESVHCCKQGCRTVAFVVVGHGSASAFLERKSRLGAIQGLDLALLVCAEHDRMLRWVEIEPDNRFQFFGEFRIVADFEGA